ncbi:hypothetical protein RAB80_014718 [Fusarium oxysporum f. sp. vasinfectum]|nr:hypothetical protein RAB80_014718 [Fusarium oxysporum f. sp. vasinfectum]KAK2926540.1 hypothetical protein FoTM2_013408 [Fusarium oxysporum f. sp. vasinfectum]
MYGPNQHIGTGLTDKGRQGWTERAYMKSRRLWFQEQLWGNDNGFSAACPEIGSEYRDKDWKLNEDDKGECSRNGKDCCTIQVVNKNDAGYRIRWK